MLSFFLNDTFPLALPEFSEAVADGESLPVPRVSRVAPQTLVKASLEVEEIVARVFTPPRLGLLLVRDLFVKMRMWKGSLASPCLEEVTH